jgi:hypothetical protein
MALTLNPRQERSVNRQAIEPGGAMGTSVAPLWHQPDPTGLCGTPRLVLEPEFLLDRPLWIKGPGSAVTSLTGAGDDLHRSAE